MSGFSNPDTLRFVKCLTIIFSNSLMCNFSYLCFVFLYLVVEYTTAVAIDLSIPPCYRDIQIIGPPPLRSDRDDYPVAVFLRSCASLQPQLCLGDVQPSYIRYGFIVELHCAQVLSSSYINFVCSLSIISFRTRF